MIAAFQALMMFVMVFAVLGAVADKEKIKYILLFSVAGILFLCSFMGGIH